MDSMSPRSAMAAANPTGLRAFVASRAAWIAFLAPAGLALWSAFAIWQTYSPTPYVDQWMDLYRWRHSAQTGLLAYLFAQHNEHRILFPRLVFIADWRWFQGRDILNLVVIGIIQLLGAAFFIRLSRLRRSGPLGVLGLALALSLIASLLQWESLFWGFCVQVVGVYVSACWALYAYCAASRDPAALRWGQMLGAVALLVVASFNMANGVFAGAAMLLVAILTRRGWVAMAIAAAATTALLAINLYGYHAPSANALTLPFHPGRLATYFVCYLGNIWSPDRTLEAALAGLVGCASTLGMALVVTRDGTRDPIRAALLGVALFVGLSAALASIGRAQLGLLSAASSRYMTSTAYFWAAQALFWALTVQRASSLPPRLTLGAIFGLAILRLVTLQPLGYAQLFKVHEWVVLASSSLLGGTSDGNAQVPVILFVDGKMVQDDLPYLREARLSLFADPPVAVGGSRFARPPAPKGACRGAFDSLGTAPDLQGRTLPAAQAAAWRGGGWGWDVAARRPIEHVVLVDGAGRVLGVGLSGVRRQGVDVSSPWDRNQTTGWTASMTPGPGGEVVAYGVTAAGAACELGRKAWGR